MASITIQKNKVEEQKGMVILPIREYEKLLRQAVPTYYLTGKAAKRLDALVEEGMEEYRAGKTISAPSLGVAVRRYGKKRAR